MTRSEMDRFTVLTEGPGTHVTREGASMVVSRYHYAAERANGRRVLELGCGPGIGFSLLGATGRSVVGGDIEEGMLRQGHETYGGEFPFVRLTAESLPFVDGSFDLIMLFEALYYIPEADSALDEMARVLAPGGTLMFVNANPERGDFIPSPHSTHYHSASELSSALTSRGLEVEIFGAFPIPSGWLSRGISDVRRVTSRLGLVPRTLRVRALLKRLVYGRPIVLPRRLTGSEAEAAPLTAIADPSGGIFDYKVFYIVGSRT